MRNVIKCYKIELTVTKSFTIYSLALDERKTMLFTIKFNFFSLFTNCKLLQ